MREYRLWYIDCQSTWVGYKIYFDLKLIYYSRCSCIYKPRVVGHGGATLERTYNIMRTIVSTIDQDLISRVI